MQPIRFSVCPQFLKKVPFIQSRLPSSWKCVTRTPWHIFSAEKYESVLFFGKIIFFSIDRVRDVFGIQRFLQYTSQFTLKNPAQCITSLKNNLKGHVTKLV